MDPLAWLGLRDKPTKYPRLHAIKEVVRSLLPNDEAVVVRYIVVVSALLARTALADGRVLASERASLRRLFEHIDDLPAAGIDRLVACLEDQVGKLHADELEVCYGEIRSICDHGERIQVLHRLVEVAHADGRIQAREEHILQAIASELSISNAELDSIIAEATQVSRET